MTSAPPRRTNRRSLLRAGAISTLLVAQLLLHVTPASAQTTERDPIVGVWTHPGGEVTVSSSGGSSFQGIVTGVSGNCWHLGQQLWTISGKTGTTYSGTVAWFNFDCSDRGQSPGTFVINDAATSLEVCSTDPVDGHGECYTMTKDPRVVDLSGPEFVERAERFEFDVEVLGVDDCNGLRIVLLKQVAGVFGVIKGVDATACTFTIKQRVRRDATFKARIAGERSTDSQPVTIKVR